MPRRGLPLADVAVRNAKPQANAFKLSDGGGLNLEVLPTGGKSWRMKYRRNGQEKRIVFGLWPDVTRRQAPDNSGGLLRVGGGAIVTASENKRPVNYVLSQ